MRSLFFSIVLVLLAARAGAQRFYYFETSNLVDQLIKKGLEKSDQHVVPSVMASEYTVRTKVAGSDDNRQLNLEIILADSVTNKEVYRSYEQFCFTAGDKEPEATCTAAIRAFLLRRVREMILTAKQDHAGLFNETMTARKDKT